MAFDPAHPAAQATALAQDVGGTVVSVAAALAPVAVPFVLAMAAITWVLRKFGLSGSAGLSAGGVGGGLAFDSDGERLCKSCRHYTVEDGEGLYCVRCNDLRYEQMDI